MKVRTPIYAFNGGEISRRMEGRADLDGIYDRAFSKMLNYVATVEGPATKRPGFRYIKEAALTSTWLSRFVFNTTQAYVIEWADKKLRFFTNGGRIDVGGAPYELDVPYRSWEASRISSKQSFDRLYLAHPSHPPGMITRTTAETFSHATVPLKNGPFKDWNTDKTKTIDWSGSGLVDGIATITAGFPLFQAGHVGAPFMFEVKSFSNIRAWEPGVKTNGNDAASLIQVGTLVRSDGKIYKCTNASAKFTGSIEPTHIEGKEWDGSSSTPGTQDDGNTAGCQWEYQYDRFGIGIIQTVTSTTTATIKVTRALPDLAELTHHWAHAAFSNVEGWPQLVGVWGSRLIYVKGTELIGSVVGDYWNMAPIDDSGTFAPDLAFRLELSISDPPTWLHVDKEYLLLGNASEEIVVGQTNRAAGISGTNLTAQPQSAYGASECWPVAIGTAVMFVQRGGKKIREAAFSYEQGRFVGTNNNIYARHVTRSGIKWLAWQQEPEELLWGGRGDGTLIVHPHNPEQAVKGFSRVELAEGSILAGASIPSEDGGLDELWILAELDGSPAVLQLADFWDEDAGLEQADALFVDWCVSYDGNELDDGGVPLGAKQTFTSGLSHLNGKRVRILADGTEINSLTVTGGAITLPKPAWKVHVGLGYEARLKLLRAEARGAPTLQGMRKRALKLFARLIDSAALVLLNRDGARDRMFDRSNAMAMDTPPALFNGDTPNTPTGSSSDYSDAPELVSDDALPSIVTLIVPTYEIEEPVQ
jgi:hypothetical protein